MKMDNGPFKSMFNSSPVGQALTTWDGRILRINQAGAALLGLVPDDLIGQTAQQFYKDVSDRESFLDELLCSGTFVHRHVEVVKSDKSFLRLCVAAKKVGNGVIRGVLWAFHEDAKPT
jgi:PAS domain S-box-containing protein